MSVPRGVLPESLPFISELCFDGSAASKVLKRGVSGDVYMQALSQLLHTAYSKARFLLHRIETSIPPPERPIFQKFPSFTSISSPSVEALEDGETSQHAVNLDHGGGRHQATGNDAISWTIMSPTDQYSVVDTRSSS
jgi:hypothetical protein